MAFCCCEPNVWYVCIKHPESIYAILNASSPCISCPNPPCNPCIGWGFGSGQTRPCAVIEEIYNQEKTTRYPISNTMWLPGGILYNSDITPEKAFGIWVIKIQIEEDGGGGFGPPGPIWTYWPPTGYNGWTSFCTHQINFVTPNLLKLDTNSPKLIEPPSFTENGTIEKERTFYPATIFKRCDDLCTNCSIENECSKFIFANQRFPYHGLEISYTPGQYPNVNLINDFELFNWNSTDWGCTGGELKCPETICLTKNNEITYRGYCKNCIVPLSNSRQVIQSSITSTPCPGCCPGCQTYYDPPVSLFPSVPQ